MSIHDREYADDDTDVTVQDPRRPEATCADGDADPKVARSAGEKGEDWNAI